MAITDLRSSYAQALTQYDKDKNKIADWEEVLTGLQNTLSAEYETEAAPIQQEAKYNISQAYENYKKTQLNLLQNQRLGTGFKESLVSDLSKEYGRTYSTIKQQEQTQLRTLDKEFSSQYNKYLNELTKNLETEATALDALEREIYAYRGIDSAQAEALNYYAQNEQGVYELTDEGRDFFAQSLLQANSLNGETKQFIDYLYEKDSDLYDYYVSNISKVGELVGGLTPEDLKGTYAQSSAVKKIADNLKQQIQTEYESLSEGQKDYLKRRGINFTDVIETQYNTEADRRTAYQDYLEKMLSVPKDVKPTPEQKTAAKLIGQDSIYTYNGKEYKGVYISGNSKTASEITRYTNLKKRISSGELSYGDTIRWNGNTYIIKKSTTKIPNFVKLIEK